MSMPDLIFLSHVITHHSSLPITATIIITIITHHHPSSPIITHHHPSPSITHQTNHNCPIVEQYSADFSAQVARVTLTAEEFDMSIVVARDGDTDEAQAQAQAQGDTTPGSGKYAGECVREIAGKGLND